MIIYKYPLELLNEQTVLMPKSSTVCEVQMQGESICLWAAVDPKSSVVKRKFYIVGTGTELWFKFFKCDFIGTVQHGNLVWHVFDGGVA